jgi:hypothetical protein
MLITASNAIINRLVVGGQWFETINIIFQLLIAIKFLDIVKPRETP